MAAFERAWTNEGFLTREHEEARLAAGRAALRRFREEQLRPGSRRPRLRRARVHLHPRRRPDPRPLGPGRHRAGRGDAEAARAARSRAVAARASPTRSSRRSRACRPSGSRSRTTSRATSATRPRRASGRGTRSSSTIYAMGYEALTGRLPDAVQLLLPRVRAGRAGRGRPEAPGEARASRSRRRPPGSGPATSPRRRTDDLQLLPVPRHLPRERGAVTRHGSRPTRASVRRAITFDFGNTLVPVDRGGLEPSSGDDRGGRRRRIGPFDRGRLPRRLGRGAGSPVPRGGARSSARWTSTSRVVRVLARLRGHGAAGRRRRWDDAAAAARRRRRRSPGRSSAYSAAFVGAIPPPRRSGRCSSASPRRYRLADPSRTGRSRRRSTATSRPPAGRHLQAIVVSQRVGSDQAAPGDLRRPRRRSGLAAPAILHVGDDWAADVVGARRAGWRACLAPDAGRATRRSRSARARPAAAADLGRATSWPTSRVRWSCARQPGDRRSPAVLDRALPGDGPADWTPARWKRATGSPTSPSSPRRRRLAPRRPRRHDPRPDDRPAAGYLGAVCIGLAFGLTAMPLFWLAVFARHRRIAYRGDWPRAIRRGAWVALVTALFVVLRLQGLSAGRSPVHPGPRRRRRGDAVGRALTQPGASPVSSRRSPDTARPPGRDPPDQRDAGRRSSAGSPPPSSRSGGDPRPVAPDPRQPRARVRGAPAAGWIAEPSSPATATRSSSRPAASRRRSGRPVRRTRRRTGHGSASSPSTTRCPASATAAATTRWRRPASVRRSPSQRSRRTAGRDRLPRHAGRGARQRQGDHDRRRPLRGLDAALLFHPCDVTTSSPRPLASEDVDVVFNGLQAHASADPWKGRNALDAMILLFSSVGLWRQQLRPDARVHGIIQEGGTAANIIPDRTRAWFMLRSAASPTTQMKGGSRELAGAAALATGTTVEVTFSGGAMSMQPEPRRSRPAGSRTAAAYGVVDQGPTRISAAPTWATSAGSARRSTRSSRSATTGTPGHSIRSETPRRPPGRRDDPPGGDARRPGRRTSCSPTPRSSRRPGASSATPG